MNLKVNDTAPNLSFDLSANAVGVSSATVRAKNAHTGEPVITAGTVVWDDQSNGVGHYVLQTADTTGGDLFWEVRLVYDSGLIQRFPQRGYLEAKVQPHAG